MSEEETFETAPMRYSADSVARTSDGLKVSMKNACYHCGYSVYWCKCSTPRVLTSRNIYEDVIVSTF